MIRHSSRHVHHTVATWVETFLGTLGWSHATTRPFNAPKVRVERTSALFGDRILNPDKISPGLVTITIGDEDMPDPEELGGPLHAVDIPIFIDIFMDVDAHAQALAEDVRDILLGRINGTKRFLSLVDQATGDVVTGCSIELDDIERVRPDVAIALYWQVVKVTARLYYPEVVY